jgi:hypothetical protein
MSVTVSVIGQINLIDSSTGTNQLAKQLSGLAVTGTVSELVNNLILPMGNTVISLPVSPVQFIYIKNLHPSNNVTIFWTLFGGTTPLEVWTIEGGGFIMLGNSTLGLGIIALTLDASAPGTPIEMILLG